MTEPAVNDPEVWTLCHPTRGTMALTLATPEYLRTIDDGWPDVIPDDEKNAGKRGSGDEETAEGSGIENSETVGAGLGKSKNDDSDETEQEKRRARVKMAQTIARVTCDTRDKVVRRSNL